MTWRAHRFVPEQLPKGALVTIWRATHQSYSHAIPPPTSACSLPAPPRPIRGSLSAQVSTCVLLPKNTLPYRFAGENTGSGS